MVSLLEYYTRITHLWGAVRMQFWAKVLVKDPVYNGTQEAMTVCHPWDQKIHCRWGLKQNEWSHNRKLHFGLAAYNCSCARRNHLLYRPGGHHNDEQEWHCCWRLRGPIRNSLICHHLRNQNMQELKQCTLHLFNQFFGEIFPGHQVQKWGFSFQFLQENWWCKRP